MSKITIFGGRPPALLVIDNPKVYFQWFARETIKNPEKCLKADVGSSNWIDVFGYAVKLRRCYLKAFEQFIQKQRTQGHANLRRFDDDCSVSFLNNDLLGLKTVEACLVQCVTSTIVPSNPFKFLVHLTLSYGQFETEVDLFNQSSMLEVFQACQLIPIKQSYDQEDAHDLIRLYVLNELKFLPGASRSFDRHLIGCFDLLTNLSTQNNVLNEPLPPTLHSSITENASKVYDEFYRQKRSQCIQGWLLNEALEPLRPHHDNFFNTTTEQRFDITLSVPRAVGQSDESFDFQCTVLQ